MKKADPRTPSMKASGFHVRFRIRAMRKRIVRKNKRAKFYEGNYVYLRVRGPDGLVREIYLGTSSSSAAPRPPATSPASEIEGVETRSRARAAAARAGGGRTRGQKARITGGDEDPRDDEDREEFYQSGKSGWKPAPWSKKK